MTPLWFSVLIYSYSLSVWRTKTDTQEGIDRGKDAGIPFKAQSLNDGMLYIF